MYRVLQVLTMTRVIEDSPNLEEIYKIKQALSPLHLITKLLTLDSPADLRRYTLPQPLSLHSPPLQSSSCIQPLALDEKTVRSILQQRVDFSKEAIQKVKIAFTQPVT